jgi:preprotein translocase subunit YajC
VSTTASAQEGLHVGATVTDTQGGTVATITAINGANVTLHTDRHDVAVPATSFTVDGDKILFGMTRDQLNAAADQAAQQAQAAFVVGAQVHDRNGELVGPVEAVDDQSVTVKFGEQQIRLPRAALAAGNGGLVTGATIADLRTAMNSSSGTQ